MEASEIETREDWDIFRELDKRGVTYSVISYTTSILEQTFQKHKLYEVVVNCADLNKVQGLNFKKPKDYKKVLTHQLSTKNFWAFTQNKDRFKLVGSWIDGKAWELKDKSLDREINKDKYLIPELKEKILTLKKQIR